MERRCLLQSILTHTDTGESRRYAFIEYERERDAMAAYDARIDVDGRQVKLDFERERLMPGWVPRRLGGGLGGQKESGQLRFGGRYKPFRRPPMLKPNSNKPQNTNSSVHYRHHYQQQHQRDRPRQSETHRPHPQSPSQSGP